MGVVACRPAESSTEQSLPHPDLPASLDPFTEIKAWRRRTPMMVEPCSNQPNSWPLTQGCVHRASRWRRGIAGAAARPESASGMLATRIAATGTSAIGWPPLQSRAQHGAFVAAEQALNPLTARSGSRSMCRH